MVGAGARSQLTIGLDGELELALFLAAGLDVPHHLPVGVRSDVLPVDEQHLWRGRSGESRGDTGDVFRQTSDAHVRRAPPNSRRRAATSARTRDLAAEKWPQGTAPNETDDKLLAETAFISDRVAALLGLLEMYEDPMNHPF